MTMSARVRPEFSKLAALVGVMGWVAAAGAAHATEATGAEPSAEAAPVVAPPVVSPPPDVATPPEAATVSGAAAVASGKAPLDGEALVAELERAAGVIRQRLEEARRQHDVVKTLCLDDKLSQIDTTVRSASEHASNQKLAKTTKDAELAAHEGVILQVFRQRGEQLSAEANTCIGEEAAFVGDTKVAANVDPGEAVQENAEYPAYGTAVPNSPNTPGSLIGLPVSGSEIAEPPQCVSCSL